MLKEVQKQAKIIRPNAPMLRGKCTSVTAREGENMWWYAYIDIKYALTAGYNASRRAQGRM